MNLRLSLRLVPGRLETSIIALALIRGALPNLIGPRGPSLPSDAPLVGSINAIARSFNRSPETVRRHVHILANQGFFTVAPDGVRLAPSLEAGARILDYLHGAHDNLLWLLEELDGWGLLKRSKPRKQHKTPHELLLLTALDFRLHGFDSFYGLVNDDWVSWSLWNALSGMTVRHVTTDRELSRTFMVQSTPNDVRRPASVRALATVAGLPYATVWRHVLAMERGGYVRRVAGGYVILTEHLLTRAVETRVALYVQNTFDRLNAVVAKGIDPKAIPSLYRGGRPVLVPFGRASSISAYTKTRFT